MRPLRESEEKAFSEDAISIITQVNKISTCSAVGKNYGGKTRCSLSTLLDALRGNAPWGIRPASGRTWRFGGTADLQRDLTNLGFEVKDWTRFRYYVEAPDGT